MNNYVSIQMEYQYKLFSIYYLVEKNNNYILYNIMLMKV